MNRKLKEQVRIGATLRLIRELRGVRANDAATALGISRSYLANIEAGRKRLPPHVLVRACAFFDIPQIAVVNPDYAIKAKAEALGREVA